MGETSRTPPVVSGDRRLECISNLSFLWASHTKYTLFLHFMFTITLILQGNGVGTFGTVMDEQGDLPYQENNWRLQCQT